MKVSCKNPVVIRHKYIKEYILKSSYYCMNGVLHRITSTERYALLNDDDYLKKTFNTRFFDLEHSELDEFYFCNGITGECYSMFQVLPCGKCIICKERKTKQWMTRAFAENCTSTTPPLFVTLTYNDWCLPSCGLLKSHVQLFMKRLRKRLSDDGFDCNLRFFLCGEYGKNTSRPHYHLLLWNYPYMLYHDMQDYIQDSWSVIIEQTEYKTIKNRDIVYTEEILKWNIGIKQYQPKILYRKRLGFVYILFVREGAASYVMKYMRKEPTIPKDCVAPFQLYSRRGGIGSQWIDENKDFYLQNPDVLDVEMYDKWTASTHKSVLPLYYTQRLYPSRSKVIPKVIRDIFDDWSYYGNTLNALRKSLFGMKVVPLSSFILDKYDMLSPHPYKKFDELIYDLVPRHQTNIAVLKDVNFYEHTIEDIKEGNLKSTRIDSELTSVVMHRSFWNTDINSATYGKTIGTVISDELRKWCVKLYYDYSREYEFLLDFLRCYEFDKDSYYKSMNLKSLHDSYVREFVSSQPEMDIDEYSDYLNRRIYEGERKEIF